VQNCTREAFLPLAMNPKLKTFYFSLDLPQKNNDRPFIVKNVEKQNNCIL